MNQDKVIGKTTKKSTGRPTKITEMTVYKLEQAFLMVVTPARPVFMQEYQEVPFIII